MTHVSRVISLFLISLLPSACAAWNEKYATTSVPDLIACKDPRPQICTREYNPVCAIYKDGSKKTAATGCTSCSDSAVVGYTMGACRAVTVN